MKTEMSLPIDLSIIKRLFVKFSSMYGHLWTSRHAQNQEWEECANTWLCALKKFNKQTLKSGFDQILINFIDYPPTLGQFVNICLYESGMPPKHEILQLMIRGEIDHPVVKYCYDQIGSYKLRNGKETEILKMISDLYPDAVNEFVGNTFKGNEIWNLDDKPSQKKLI